MEQINEDGTNLYKLSLMTQYSADMMYEKDLMVGMTGYLSYASGGMFYSIYWMGSGESRKVQYRFMAVNPEQKSLIQMGKDNVALTKEEALLADVKSQVLQAVQTDRQFFVRTSTGLGLQVQLLSKGSNIVAYLMPYQTAENTVPIGNDFEMVFNGSSGALRAREVIRETYTAVPVDIEPNDQGQLITFHDNTLNGPAFISPTDICSLLLYGGNRAGHEHHVISGMYLSIYDVQKREIRLQKR